MAFYAYSQSLLDGAVVLYRRQSPNGEVHPTWQMRLRLPGRSGYVIRSCKTRNQHEAYAVAKDLYLTLQQKIRDGIPIRDWTFEQHWQDWFKRQVSGGSWSQSRERWHKNYFDRYFKAYFGDKRLAEFTDSFAEGYWPWRISYW